MLDPGNVQPNYELLVTRYAGSGQWDRALEASREWLTSEPDSPRAHLGAGQALVNLDRDGEAEPHLRRVLAAQPEYGFALRLFSIACFRLQRFKEADDAIHRAISLEPNEAYHWYHLGQMCHSQGDLESARRCAAKARELRPDDANFANLYALCERAGDRTMQLQRYREALALDPENAVIHNNIGVYHLSVEHDFMAAEAAFRRALHFEPSRPLFRSNLFLTLKHRDPVYRILCAPRELLLRFVSGSRGKRSLGYIGVLLLWVATARFVIGALILWGIFVWPLVKVYERLAVGDIRARAGEVGARRGGWFGYRRWPLYVRLGIFAALLVLFWGGVAFSARNEEGRKVLLSLAIVAGIVFAGAFISRIVVRDFRHRGRTRHARRRAQRFRDMLSTPPPRRPNSSPDAP
jgi:Flp pilus assembly protein TadD